MGRIARYFFQFFLFIKLSLQSAFYFVYSRPGSLGKNMKRIVSILLLFLACNVFSITVETMDEQIDSPYLTVLRLRIKNETEKEIYDVSVKYFVRKKEAFALDSFDLSQTMVRLDSLYKDVWSLTMFIDTLPPGVYPYEAGFCLGLRNADWSPRDKRLDPSYMASSNFAVNNKVEVNVDGNHLPNAQPLTLSSGMKILLDEGDSVPFAWHSVSNAEKYRLTIYSTDSQLIYQKELYGNGETVALGAGDYLWKVEAKNSTTDYGAEGAGALVNSLTAINLMSLHILEQKNHGIVSVTGHKDTPMLFVGWGEFADLREWDRPHLNREFLDENEANSCWAIAIKNLNLHYGGNLSLDEIRWYAKKEYIKEKINTFCMGDNAGGGTSEITAGLSYALDSTVTYRYVDSRKNPLTYDAVKEYLNSGKEIYIRMKWNAGATVGHAMLIDAFYTAEEGNYVRCVNVDNRGNYATFFADSLLATLEGYYIIEIPKGVRNMSPLLGVEKFDKFNTWIEWTDTDGDGITDFDEVYRFGTDPEQADSDSDGVKDKDEIYSYTILEKSNLNLNVTYLGEKADLSRMRPIAGIESEYMSDVDGDGLRAELDSDSDGDGLLDGIDPDPYRFNSFNDSLMADKLPKDVVLYARMRMKVNDGVMCDNSLRGDGYCFYVSEGVDGDYGLLMGARASAAYLYAKNNVLIRSNTGNTFWVNLYGPDELTSVRHDGLATFEKHFSVEEWPWKLNLMQHSFDEGDSVLVIHRGDTCLLNNNDRFKTLKVESGGVVYFPVGNVYVGDLQLETEGKVRFESQAHGTVLYVKGKILWKSSFEYVTGANFSLKTVASYFKLVYSGSDVVFFETNWYGTVIAPNAKIILGQNNNKGRKEIYGQFYADEIVVHQYSDLHNVPFNSEQERLEYVYR